MSILRTTFDALVGVGAIFVVMALASILGGLILVTVGAQ